MEEIREQTTEQVAEQHAEQPAGEATERLTAQASEQTGQETFVKVSGLSKRFGELVAVDKLDFTVEHGEIFGFLGPNGAGKSTTLNILSTLLDFDSGEVSVAGFDLRREPRRIKAMIGLVPQDIALFYNLTAAENVSYFASLYGLRGQKLKTAVAEALAFVGLTDQARRRAGKLSGGQQRRLNIACGIAHHPRLIILDEPTVGVDAQSREHIMSSIRTLRDRGATVIYTSHYMPEVAEICDRIAIIDHGRLVGLGTESELLAVVTDVKSLVVRLNSSAPEPDILAALRDRLSAMPDVRRVSTVENTERLTLRVDVVLTLSDITPLVRVLLDSGLQIESLTNESPDLESTFLALTGRELRQA